MTAWLGDAHTWSPQWRRSSELSDYTLQLTAEQTFELTGKVHELINSYRDLPPSDDTETVRFHTHAFPLRIK